MIRYCWDSLILFSSFRFAHLYPLGVFLISLALCGSISGNWNSECVCGGRSMGLSCEHMVQANRLSLELNKRTLYVHTIRQRNHGVRSRWNGPPQRWPSTPFSSHFSIYMAASFVGQVRTVRHKSIWAVSASSGEDDWQLWFGNRDHRESK
jgi:hypothetical protein